MPQLFNGFVPRCTSPCGGYAWAIGMCLLVFVVARNFGKNETSVIYEGTRNYIFKLRLSNHLIPYSCVTESYPFARLFVKVCK